MREIKGMGESEDAEFAAELWIKIVAIAEA